MVERPAAVLRELLDNALDAGAARIEIGLQSGGIECIEVSDDGAGMERDDSVLAFERHATSKIQSAADLRAIGSLGFRGEALAAIAAVSRVELITATGRGDGTRVRIENGELRAVEPAARARGTTVAVRSLFAAIPARRKFLKSEATELDHGLRCAQRAALARSDVGFRMRHGERLLLDAPAGNDLLGRISDVLGSRWSRNLLPISADAGIVQLRGFIARADTHRSDREGIHLFVNRRAVRDPLLLRAVLDAYRHRLPPGAYPIVVLQLELPPEEVDVNVHPAKSEVRFLHAQEVRAVVFSGLQRALGSWSAVPDLPTGDRGARSLDAMRPELTPAGSAGSIAEQPRLPFRVPVADPLDPHAATVAEPLGDGSQALPDGSFLDPTAVTLGPPSRLVALAQYADCYIVAHDENGLLIVDQHVAHERLLFEQVGRMAESGPLPRQLLMFPETTDVLPATESFISSHRETLERLGFGLESLGNGTVLIREVPVVLGKSAPAEAVHRVLDRLSADARSSLDELFRGVLATVACHAAVRKGMKLGLPQMNYLLRGLSACEAPTHCPHGRVVSLRLSPGYLERAFGRS